jgi:hypothetical protein
MPNGRCRQHGGKSTGPRTPQGTDRMLAANTRHGNQSAPKRVQQFYVTTATRRGRLTATARRLEDYLPEDMAARLAAGPPELWPPVHPTNLPFVQNPEPTPGHESPARLPSAPGPARNAARPLPRGLAAERQAARAEAAALAPWRQAIAVARAARSAARAARRTARAANHAALTAKRTARQATRTTRVPALPPARPSPPHPTEDQYSPLRRELAACIAVLRARLRAPNQPPATDAPKRASAFPRIHPMNPEAAAATAKPKTAFSRIHPMNPEPAAAPAPKSESAFSRIHPMNPETTAPSQPTRLTPTNTEAQRAATLAALPNRAARRRWKALHRRPHPDSAT